MPDSNIINGSPAKSFFVGMLTRDIDLDDAILDLIDNSLDGLLRQTKGVTSDYCKYKVSLTLKKDIFCIYDNCGGIPTKDAMEYAFRMGRPDNAPKDDDLPTIGMYGIGMKRSVFKMGTNICITTKNIERDFSVVINDSWLKDDTNWDLEMIEAENNLLENGTEIKVRNLYPGIAELFDEGSSFMSRLKDKISIYYAFVLKEGFVIAVNGENIIGRDIEFLVGDDNNKHFRPYVYQEENNGLKITIVCGIIGQPEDDNIEDETYNTPSSDKIEAGWTIACNNRIVLYADRTRLTGWGDELPKFHYQFNSIVGIVNFESNDKNVLPITTTKRGVDASSDTFLRIRRKMIDATKKFTAYTNKWKNKREEERDRVIAFTRKANVYSIVSSIIDEDPSEDKREFIPTNLPVPDTVRNNNMETIRFQKDKKLVEQIAEYLFEDKAHNKNEVGSECFDRFYESVIIKGKSI